MASVKGVVCVFYLEHSVALIFEGYGFLALNAMLTTVKLMT